MKGIIEKQKLLTEVRSLSPECSPDRASSVAIRKALLKIRIDSRRLSAASRCSSVTVTVIARLFRAPSATSMAPGRLVRLSNRADAQSRTSSAPRGRPQSQSCPISCSQGARSSGHMDRPRCAALSPVRHSCRSPPRPAPNCCSNACSQFGWQEALTCFRGSK